MIQRGQNFKQVPINIVDSSKFGRYPKINSEHTFNMFCSDNGLVPYSGYNIAILASKLRNSKQGRGIFTSIKSNRMLVVVDNNVFLVQIILNQFGNPQYNSNPVFIGNLNTFTGPVFFAENNKPQIAISDTVNIYIYDPQISATLIKANTPDFQPGYITFHDTYFLCAALSNSFYSPPATNTWRLSAQNDGTTWLSNSQSIGLLQTKPDNIQAVVRVPGRGNMIFVIGEIVTEAWFDTGAQLFPYQRNNQMNFDYGCLSPATVACMDEMVCWLAANEKSGPIIVYSDGGPLQKITTDGIDYVFSQFTNPEDSQGFLYRQDGHLFYHINFYTDNRSFFYDFNTKKIYEATDQNLNYFIAAEVAFFNNQYYFVSRNTGNIYAFDTIYTVYQDTDSLGNVTNNEIPRIRTCANIRLPSQESFIMNDIGFTIETGETNYQKQFGGDLYLITQDGFEIATQGSAVFFVSQDLSPKFIISQDGNDLIFQQTDATDFNVLIAQNPAVIQSTPRVDFSMSYDGGATFSNDFPYVLNPIGQRRNKLVWWQGGWGNDCVPQFKFWGMGRFVALDGQANIRQ